MPGMNSEWYSMPDLIRLAIGLYRYLFLFALGPLLPPSRSVSLTSLSMPFSCFSLALRLRGLLQRFRGQFAVRGTFAISFSTMIGI